MRVEDWVRVAEGERRARVLFKPCFHDLAERFGDRNASGTFLAFDSLLFSDCGYSPIEIYVGQLGSD